MTVVASERSDAVAVRLGDALRRARAASGVSQAELARRLGVIPQELNRWEAGRRRVPIETLEAAEQAMGAEPGTVFRLAGYVSDGKLIDLGSLSPGARLAVEAILRAFNSVDSNGADST